MMEPDQIRNVLEACLLVAARPMSVAQLDALFEEDEDKPDRAAIRTALAALAESYEGRGIELVEVAGGWRLQTRPTVERWVGRLFAERPPRYSRALLETLVLIAYRQPITRGEIEEVRGVAVSSNIVRTLQERQWVREVGHKDVPGRPALLGTTSEFLDYFNLKRLDELPSLGELADLDGIEAKLAAEFGVVDGAGEAANDGIAPGATGEDAATGAGEANIEDEASGTAEARTEEDASGPDETAGAHGTDRAGETGDGREASGGERAADLGVAVGDAPEAELVPPREPGLDAEADGEHGVDAGIDAAADAGSPVEPEPEPELEPDRERGIDAGAASDGGVPDADVERIAGREAELGVGAAAIDAGPVTPLESGGGVAVGGGATRPDGVSGTAPKRVDGAVVEVFDVEPAVTVAGEPIDPDGAEASLLRRIGEFAEEHRREIEARDAFVRRSATTTSVPEADGPAANDEHGSADGVGRYPGGRPDASGPEADRPGEGSRDDDEPPPDPVGGIP